MTASPGLLLQALLLPLLAGPGMAAADPLPVPGLDLVVADGLVTINISMLNNVVHPVYATYTIVLQNRNSSAQTLIKNKLHLHRILLSDLLPGIMYCAAVRVSDTRSNTHSAFSGEKCFRTPSKALPGNLRVEAIDTRFMLKWDWDHLQNPNVTFSVENCTDYLKQWSAVTGCENITALQCDVSALPNLYFIYNFRVSTYDGQTGERSANTVRFQPLEDTVMGPPAGLNLSVDNGDLRIAVEPPEGFKVEALHASCTWLYHLEHWTTSEPSQVHNQTEKSPYFKIKAVQASTEYCARARTICDRGHQKPGLQSKVYCLTTDPRSNVKEWIIGLTFLVIVVLSVMVYICLCPLKRYIKHIVYPRSKLPSSIEKFFQDSPQNTIRNHVHVVKEEHADCCIVIPHQEPDNGAPNG